MQLPAIMIVTLGPSMRGYITSGSRWNQSATRVCTMAGQQNFRNEVMLIASHFVSNAHYIHLGIWNRNGTGWLYYTIPYHTIYSTILI